VFAKGVRRTLSVTGRPSGKRREKLEGVKRARVSKCDGPKGLAIVERNRRKKNSAPAWKRAD